MFNFYCRVFVKMHRKNKRKNLEPKKLLVQDFLVSNEQNEAKRPRLGSTGSVTGELGVSLEIYNHRSPVCSLGSAGSEQHHSPVSSSQSRSPSPVNGDNIKPVVSRSPSPDNDKLKPVVPPKMRFKQVKKISHFRPWGDNEDDDNDQKPNNLPALLQTTGAFNNPDLSLIYNNLKASVPVNMSKPSPIQDEPLCLVKHDRTEPVKPVSPQSFPADTKPKQRNYKNMTRERRVEANARERQRVHTITAAFDSLQAAIPTDNNTNNKLSKLSIIKIATSYIMVLSRMAGYDYSIDQSEPSVEECVKKCSELIQSESKTRRATSCK